jgi:hypothetical protein
VAEITDEFMKEQLTRAATYTAVLLKAADGYGKDGSRQVIWEHGRRNFSLRADGLLAVVCPVADETDLCGIGIFAASVERTRELMDDDPGVKAGVFTYETHPVRSFPGDALP